jgi:3-hydroxyacyl-CoA dehydrogenase/enoyl-CoA hydratase/3-hydroxybutyryl-CoA epimerase
VPGEKMNTLKAEFAGQIAAIIAEARRDPQAASIAITACPCFASASASTAL